MTEAMRVLIIDDQEDYRSLLGRALSRFGDFEIIGQAGDGDAGIAAAAEQHPDVVLLDLSLPGRDGLETIPEIAKASPGSLIVVLSAWPEQEAGPAARSLGATGYLEKGLPIRTLVSELSRQIMEARAV